MCISMLYCAIGIQECAAQIGNCLPLPGHNHPFLFCHDSNTVSFQILLFSSSNKGICIFGFNHNSHTLLRFRNGNFSTIQAIVLLTDGIQVDFQAGSQLTDCDRNTACTEVITTLNEPSHFRIAEQALDLPFFRGITLLNLGCHSGQRLHIVALGRTGGATDAVTTGAATKQNNYITCSRALTANIIGRCSCYNSATLQTLGNIAIMIHFSNMAGSKTDLVAIGRITCSSSLADLSLGQLAGQGFGDTFSGVTCTGNSHCLVDIGTTGQGVTDTATNTGSCTTKRLNFRGMVMGLVFEHQQPILLFPVHSCIYMNGTSVDFLRFIQFRQQTTLLKGLGADGSDIHKGLGALSGFLFTINFHTGSQVALISSLDSRIINANIVNMGRESSMTAVIGPVGINHTNFRNSGITMLLITEICLKEF